MSEECRKDYAQHCVWMRETNREPVPELVYQIIWDSGYAAALKWVKEGVLK